MDAEKYDYNTNDSFSSFEFVSEGPNGKIKKIVNYKQINEWQDGTPVVNLGFGDWDGVRQKVSDQSVSNNADRDKILATVASTVIDFTDRFGKLPIIVKGSTQARTRLYQMVINTNLAAVLVFVDIYGLNVNDWETFQNGRNYSAFLVIRK